ncbi:hypothetical protein KJA13_02330 [Patescibacteria group bacterium]|nr:hypothetical protein [Patescibacteria group bacterium]
MIKVLYDQGSARIPEDGIIFQPPYYYAVTDGITGIYLPDEGPTLFHGMTGGQLASHIISYAFRNASPATSSLEGIVRRANSLIRQDIEASGLSLKESELLPSAAFVVASVNTTNIHILQGGDALAIWQTKDGTLGATPNKTYSYEEELLLIIAELMKKHKGDRQKMWEEFRPILTEKRRANINTKQGGFALLNGQPEFEHFWQKFTLPRAGIGFLLLFSDGLIPFEWTKNELGMAGEIIRLYKKGGLYAILEATRQIADDKKSLTHEDYPEATAIAIEF